MEINNTNIGAATYALKKSNETPNLLMSVIESAAITPSGTLAENQPAAETSSALKEAGKGKIIDIVA